MKRLIRYVIILVVFIIAFLYSGFSFTKVNVVDLFGKVYNIDAFEGFVNREGNINDIRIIHYSLKGRLIVDLHYYGEYHIDGKFNYMFDFGYLTNLLKQKKMNPITNNKLVFTINGHKVYKTEDSNKSIYYLQKDISSDEISAFILLEYKNYDTDNS